MSITQKFYDSLAPHYDKLFFDWQRTTGEQAQLLHSILETLGLGLNARILDCAAGIGTQAIGLASLGYRVTASDISEGALAEAKRRAADAHVAMRFECADFRALERVFSDCFDAVIAMDNALPHMLTHADLAAAVGSISSRVREDGVFIGSIRDYDALLAEKPPYSPPYIHQTEKGRRVSFQTWDWEGDVYRLTQYIIEDEGELVTNKFTCAYRAVRREELSRLFADGGFSDVRWLFPGETGFYQPILVARK